MPADGSTCDERAFGARAKFDTPDGVIAARTWRNPGAPTILFSHATGFCAAAYGPLLSALAADFDIVAIDLRGHGRTRLPADPERLKDWSVFGKDIAAVATMLNSQTNAPVILAGHSLGAASSLIAAPSCNVAALALIEPVIMPDIIAALARTPLWPLVAQRLPLVKGARGRRDHWRDAAEAHARYRRKPFFAKWTEGALEGYLADGLV